VTNDERERDLCGNAFDLRVSRDARLTDISFCGIADRRASVSVEKNAIIAIKNYPTDRAQQAKKKSH